MKRRRGWHRWNDARAGAHDRSAEGGEQFATRAERDVYEARYPLDPGEVERRAKLADHRADHLDAADPECPICQAMKSPCGSHLAMKLRPELRQVEAEAGARVAASVDRSAGCELCGGTGQVLTKTGHRRACAACNAGPPYPGIGPLAAAAMPSGPRFSGSPGKIAREKAEADARARGYWAEYNGARGVSTSPAPRVVPAVARSEASRNAPPLGEDYFAAKRRSDLLWAGFLKLKDKAREDAYVARYWRTDVELPDWVLAGDDAPAVDCEVDLFE